MPSFSVLSFASCCLDCVPVKTQKTGDSWASDNGVTGVLGITLSTEIASPLPVYGYIYPTGIDVLSACRRFFKDLSSQDLDWNGRVGSSPQVVVSFPPLRQDRPASIKAVRLRRGEGAVLFLTQHMALLAKKKKVPLNPIIDCNGLRIEVNAGDKDEEQNRQRRKVADVSTGALRQPSYRCWGSDDQCWGKRVMITPEKATRSHLSFPVLNLFKFR